MPCIRLLEKNHWNNWTRQKKDINMTLHILKWLWYLRSFRLFSLLESQRTNNMWQFTSQCGYCKDKWKCKKEWESIPAWPPIAVDGFLSIRINHVVLSSQKQQLDTFCSYSKCLSWWQLKCFYQFLLLLSLRNSK